MQTWFKRLLGIYVFWMIVYLPFYWPIAGTGTKSLREFVLTLIIGYYQLWYLSGMLFAGVMLYLLRNASNQLLLLAMVLLFFVGVVLQYDVQFLHPGTSIWRYRNFLFMGVSPDDGRLFAAQAVNRKLVRHHDHGLDGWRYRFVDIGELSDPSFQ